MKILPSWLYKNKKQKYTAIFFILSWIIFAFVIIYSNIRIIFGPGLNNFDWNLLYISGFLFWVAGMLYIKYSDIKEG